MVTSQQVDEVMSLMMDTDKLQDLPLPTSGIPIMRGPSKDFFQMTLPHKQITEIVATEKKQILSHLHVSDIPRFEHVGSTSIEGMPGTKMADAALICNSFPPSRNVVQALLQSGWKFISVSAFDLNTFWFTKCLEMEPLKGELMLLNVLGKDNRMADLLLKTRDLCNTDKEAFEEYMNAKVDAAKGSDGSFATTFEDYKMMKARHPFSMRLMKEFQIQSPHHAERFVEKVKESMEMNA